MRRKKKKRRREEEKKKERKKERKKNTRRMMVKMRAGAADTKLNKQQHRTQKTNISSCKERCGDVYK